MVIDLVLPNLNMQQTNYPQPMTSEIMEGLGPGYRIISISIFRGSVPIFLTINCSSPIDRLLRLELTSDNLGQQLVVESGTALIYYCTQHRQRGEGLRKAGRLADEKVRTCRAVEGPIPSTPVLYSRILIRGILGGLLELEQRNCLP